MAYATWILAIGILLGYECYALKTKRMTLSRAVWNVTARWPFFSVIVAFIAGVLASHFFWISCGPCS